MASIFPQKPIKYYESLTWEQLSEELKKVEKGVKKGVRILLWQKKQQQIKLLN